MTISERPHKAQPRGMPDDAEAWWYENKRSIDVLIRDSVRGTMCCRIERAVLERWLEKTRGTP